MRVNFVGRSVVSAITQTPASGPLLLDTTPPNSFAPTVGAVSALCWALDGVCIAANATTLARAMLKYRAFLVSIRPPLSGVAVSTNPDAVRDQKTDVLARQRIGPELYVHRARLRPLAA